ncbi:Acyl-lipid (7-3)-desaturase [Seminavis robusta]|uniref:Acyl-lipid (7-3)-desaturase n=1 Tax=Seminavis robusta TaxID=568900 RepID=A0A9N8E9Z2_9STRA|nr:Acyl-lipid (7-3)-desaturase [Seminavis robusta]|eukprot:Sro671_g184820.1 Acyl-lipid (7-3)-desaturase (420) ;mRNA; f:11022-12281
MSQIMSTNNECNEQQQKGKANGGKFSVPVDFPNHPGGQDTLNGARGHTHKEFLFLTSHIGLDLDGRIAQVAKSRGMALPQRGEAYNEIHGALCRIIQEHPEQVTIYRVWCLFLTVMFPTGIIGFTVTGSRWWAAILGFVHVSYSFNIFHMRHHSGGKVYGIGWLDKLTEPIYDFLDRTYCFSIEGWRKLHNESHHLVTNDPTSDYDILSTVGKGFRIHPDIPYHPHHRFQPYYLPILLALNGLTFSISNVKKRGGHPVFCMIYWITLFILPTYLHGWHALKTMVATIMLFIGLLITHLFQISHNHSDLAAFSDIKKRPAVDSMGRPKNIDDFMQLQMLESMSWGGYLSCLLFGGINYQIEHHLAPCVPSPLLYHYLSPFLREMAQRRGWSYVYEPDFASAMASYHEHIYQMSLPPKKLE